MASLNAYPPLVLHPSSSQRLDFTSAHTILHTFLDLANLDPAYRPDSTLTERGPEANSSSGNPNLTLHHLNRVKLGIEGISLGVEDFDAGFFGSREASAPREGGGTKRKWQDRDATTTPVKARIPQILSTAEDDGDNVVTAVNADARENGCGEEGWQDRQVFELAQGDQGVDKNTAQRDPAAVDTDGMGEEIVEGEPGRMINLNDGLDGEDGRTAETVRADDLIGAQQAEEQKSGPTIERERDRAFTQVAKEERKRLKKIRSKETKRTAKGVNAREKPEHQIQERSRQESINVRTGEDISSQHRRKQNKQKMMLEQKR